MRQYRHVQRSRDDLRHRQRNNGGLWKPTDRLVLRELTDADIIELGLEAGDVLPFLEPGLTSEGRPHHHSAHTGRFIVSQCRGHLFSYQTAASASARGHALPGFPGMCSPSGPRTKLP